MTMQTMLVLGFCAMVTAQQTPKSVATPVGKTAAEDVSPNVHTIVERMTNAQYSDHQQWKAPYTVVRQYTLSSGTNETSDSKVVAEVSYVPPGKKEYEIREASGSGRGEKVVRRVLDHETSEATDWHSSAVTDANYDFALLGREQSKDCNCYVLAITPKRDAKDLVKGKVYVDPDSYQIRRLVGELVKSPSWWVKRVNVTLFFNEVRGMWLQTAGYADAEVRLFGRHVLETHDLGYRTDETVASNDSSHHGNAVVRTGARNSGGAMRGRSSAIPVLGTSVVMGPR